MKRTPLIIFGCGLIAVILGLRWWVVATFGTDLPEWDQWDAEGFGTLLPWFQGRPMLPELFRPHNEHYVVLTKLLNLGLTLVNGQWDQRLECMVNAFLPAAVAFGFLVLANRFVPVTATLAFGFFLAFVWGVPVAWHNVISGFHSQQFFLIGLSLATIALLPFARSYSTTWWCGVVSCVLVPLTMASGILAAFTVIVILMVRIALKESAVRATLPSILLAALVFAVGWLTRHEVDHHAAMKAQSFQDFFMTMLRGLHWPASESPWAALLWAPWMLLSLHLVFRRDAVAARVAGWALVGFGTWVWLQLAATAYARGAGAPYPSSRYLDTLLVGSCTNLLALAWLGWHASKSRMQRVGVTCVGIVWLWVFMWGIWPGIRAAYSEDLPRAAAHFHNAIVQTRAYLATGDMAHLQHPDIPYPGADAFAQRLEPPELRSILPPSVTTGFDPAEPEAPAAAPKTLLSRLALWAGKHGLIVAAIGSLLMLLVSYATSRRPALSKTT